MPQRKHSACGRCSAPIDGPGNRRYCSEACMVAARNERSRLKGRTPEEYEAVLNERAAERDRKSTLRREKKREQLRAKYRTDPAYRDRIAKWNRDNAALRNERARATHRALRINAINAYGPDCSCCGEARFEFLAIDHIDGGGNAHRKQLRQQGISAGAGFLKLLEKDGFPSGFRILCHNCNSAYGYYGVCPHQDTEAENLTRS